MARQRSNPNAGDMLREAEEAMATAQASLERIGEVLGDATGQTDRAIREALEVQQRAVLEATRAQEQAVAAAEAAVVRAIAATRIQPRKR